MVALTLFWQLERQEVQRMETKKEKNTVTTRAIADVLGVSTVTVQGMLERRELRGTRAGRNWRIPRSELERVKGELEGVKA
jgi:excisionase family DNA binding protein